nr:integrase, catalytic region, zinc finger, CCHC-type, peptidase aspartic, catalytic [Tanacetum cinerariifolium]
MLDKIDFESWKKRIHLYYLGKDNGVNILKSIDEGPYKMGKFRETLTKGTEGALHLGLEQDRVFADLTPEEKESVLIILEDHVSEFSTSGFVVLENVKKGVGYNVVPLPAADLYRSPKKDLSWTGLPEFADDTVTDYSRPSPTVESTSAEGQSKNSTTAENGESTDSILSKPAVKFVKAGDRPAERPTTNKAKFVKAAERPTTYKVETTKKPAVRYAEMYRRTSKRSTVRGNQRN